MRDESGFTLIEVLVVITILGTLLGMAMPRLAGVREQARVAAMKMNLHGIQIVVEAFHSEKGYYADDFYEDGYGSYFPGGVYEQQLGTLPTNPWTGRQMDPDQFNPEDYDTESDLSNVLEDGPNDAEGYDVGEVVYGVWEPDGALFPAGYGLVGIGRNGRSLRDWDVDGNAVMFVLHN
jgi:prepilin-type N-terminal cleavage/methylation domain-containing protein